MLIVGLEHFIRMLIHRYRFSVHLSGIGPSSEQAKDVAMRNAQRSAMQIIAKHLEVSLPFNAAVLRAEDRQSRSAPWVS